MWKIRSYEGNVPLRSAKKIKVNPFLILGIIYGPLCIFHGLYLTLPKPFDRDFDALLWLIGGTLALVLGLTLLYANQQRLERRLDELEQLKAKS